ncbi:MAG: UDP-3-O-acyl-N-acetylglucosamine deacetylase, partial [Desulfobulbaceae bacterium]|nr:UDP-3-O-acyl-N-acetylglucosamine deacetylase [Candidatus Desulfatifera sulfidica]
VNLVKNPAPTDSGFRFSRNDLPGTPTIPARMDQVSDTRLATTIGHAQARISTTEHLLAALRSYGIDNAHIEVDAPEIPIMDGSAGPFMLLLKRAGRKQQESCRKVLRITKEIHYTDGNAEITISPYDGFKVSGEIDFNDAMIKKQQYSIDLSGDRFIKEIARARTFGYVEQVEELWANGLALGGTLDNVIAIHWNRQTILNEDGLRFHDEFIRHKVLDLIGDLALIGCPILGQVSASRCGHTQHVAFMKEIAAHPECWELVELRENGSHSVLKQMVSSTKAAAGEMISPLLTPQTSKNNLSQSPC